MFAIDRMMGKVWRYQTTGAALVRELSHNQQLATIYSVYFGLVHLWTGSLLDTLISLDILPWQHIHTRTSKHIPYFLISLFSSVITLPILPCCLTVRPNYKLFVICHLRLRWQVEVGVLCWCKIYLDFVSLPFVAHYFMYVFQVAILKHSHGI